MANRHVYKSRPSPGPPRVTPASVQAEVVTNIKNQRLGPPTVADLGLPPPFLTPLARRIMQTWFQERFRVVADDVGAGGSEHNTPPAPAPAPRTPALPVTKIRCPQQPVAGDSPAVPPPARNFRGTHGRVDEPPYESPSPEAPAP